MRLSARARLVTLTLALLIALGSTPSVVLGQSSHEVVFKVGVNASVNWFEIDSPSVHGTLHVTNPPYADRVGFNAAAVDIARNRLLYVNDATTAGDNQAYSISLNDLQLTPGAATPVTVTSIGTWQGSGTNAGYRKADGDIYYFVDGTTQLRRLTFGTSGLITGYTTVGNFVGPTAMTGGDIDFDSNGSIWISGTNQAGAVTLWNFDFATLDATKTLALSRIYNGMTFDAAGTHLYGYTDANYQYGLINPTTGGLQSVLDTDSTFFAGGGDLATGIEEIVLPAVPEPTAVGCTAVGVVIWLASRRMTRRVNL